MTLPKPYSEPLKAEWIDALGHLNEGCYLVPFANAAWPFYEHFGLGITHFERTGCGFYTVEGHLRYVKEIRAPAILEIEPMILGSDAKRVHYAAIMRVNDIERATFESMALYVDTRVGRAVPIPEDARAILKAAEVAAPPAWAGHAISLTKKGG